MVHANLGVISPIQGRPIQGALWYLKMALITGLQKLEHPNHPRKGYGQYLHTSSEQGLIFNILFSLPKIMGEYFVVPDDAFTDTRQKISQSQWEAEKTLDKLFDTVCTTFTQNFERIINKTYHTGATNMGQRSFGFLAPKTTLENLLRLYGNPSLPELERELLKLHDSMDRTLSVEVMLHGREKIQMFLLENPGEGRKLTKVLMIR